MPPGRWRLDENISVETPAREERRCKRGKGGGGRNEILTVRMLVLRVAENTICPCLPPIKQLTIDATSLKTLLVTEVGIGAINSSVNSFFFCILLYHPPRIWRYPGILTALGWRLAKMNVCPHGNNIHGRYKIRLNLRISYYCTSIRYIFRGFDWTKACCGWG